MLLKQKGPQSRCKWYKPNLCTLRPIHVNVNTLAKCLGVSLVAMLAGKVCAQSVVVAPGVELAGSNLTAAAGSEAATPAQFDWTQFNAVPSGLSVGAASNASLRSFVDQRFDDRSGLRNNFTDFPEFEGGLTVVSESAALKIGGYVKADLIADFDPISSTDTFDTGAIEIGSADRRNARLHARQTRLSFDTRWKTSGDLARAFIEVDFFGDRTGSNDALRLRHAYGRLGNLTVGQTWTTFTDPSAVPQTLDFEGAVSNVNRRQGLVRYQAPLAVEGLSLAASIENPRVLIEVPAGVQGSVRTETPDFVARVRFERDWGEFQIAGVLRELGFQPVGQAVVTDTAWGFNFTGSARSSDRLKAYYQITFGEGVGSYRGSPDVVATSNTTAEILPVFGWMVGLKYSWLPSLTSNVTYSELHAGSIAGQAADNLRETSYFAVNLIQNPYDRVFWGVEYLHGFRQNQSLASATATRLQFSCGFYLP